MAATVLPYLKNLDAKENQALDTTAVTPHSAAVQHAVSTVFSQCTLDTSATTGSASALPTDPAGYIEVAVGGDLCKIPYYNA